MQYAKYKVTIPECSTWSRVNPLFAVITCLLLVSVFLAGCAAPFSDLQSAKLAGKGKVEATPSFSSISFDDEESRHVQDHLGLQAAYGVSDMADFRLRFEHIVLDKDDEDPFNVIGFGPKIRVVKDVVALNLPFGFALHDGTDVSDTWSFHPTLLFTPLRTSTFEINTSGKALIPLNSENSEVLIAFNLGAGLSTNIEKWAIRPELGILINPGEDGHFMHLSIGLAVSP